MKVAYSFLGFLSINMSLLMIPMQPSSSFYHIPMQYSTNSCANFQAPSIPNGNSPEFLGEYDSLVIPLKRAGKLLMVEAEIDNQVGNLIFDTGASGLVLNNTYFRNCIRADCVTPNGITGSVGQINRTIADTIKLSGLLYLNVRADLADLGHIEDRRGVKILGLFGLNLFRKFEIIIDVRNNELKLIKIDKKGNRVKRSSGCFKSDYTQTIIETNNILFVTGTISGKNLKFCFDTGAEINVVSSSVQEVVLNTISINRRSKLGGAASSTIEVIYGSMNDFSFGDKKLENMQTVIASLESLEEAYGTLFSGVLGCDFLEKGVICINMIKNQLGICFTKEEKV